MTQRQLELLEFIEKFHAENNGVSPSCDEMRIALGKKSKSSIHRMLLSLQEQGRIARPRYRSRDITVIKPARKTCWNCGCDVDQPSVPDAVVSIDRAAPPEPSPFILGSVA